MGLQIVSLANGLNQIVNVAGGIVPRGAYNGSTTYAIGDMVDYNGSSYVLFTTASSGTLPTNGTYWGIVANKGDTGATGATGPGVVTGGTAHQALTKVDSTNYNTQWETIDKTFIGLSNVDNTSDATKNAATATLTNKTLTTPKIDTINDTNGASMLTIVPTASAVNYFQMSNTATGGTPAFTATGSDTNISINLVPKGTGTVQANAIDVVTTTGNQTLTNKTISAPQLTGTSQIQSTGTLELYNTADQTTNYEKFVARYNSNVLELAGLYGGTGTARILRLGAATGAGSAMNRYFEVNSISTTILSMQWGSTGVGTSTTPIVSVGSASTLVSSTVVQSAFGVTPTVNQSGTGGYTALLVNPTETATGSGTKLLADFQVGGVSKAKIDNTGVITSAVGTSSGNVVTIDGTQTLTNKTLTTPKIDTIKDTTQGLNTLGIFAPASAVNYVQAVASATGNNVGIYAQGSDTNIGISLNPKGTSKLYTGGVEVTTISGTQTLTNKTLTDPKITNGSTGAGSASLGANSPAVTNTAPYTWLKMISSDGSTVYVPAWK